MENPDNIVPVCNDCSEKRKAETQKNLPALSDFVGKYVKKRFEDEHGAEHMWVYVTSVNESAGTLIGTLDNKPIVVGNLSHNDEVVVYQHEIEAIIEDE
jgi:uncharacterized protein YegJ (DUF2314 family)